MDYDVNNYDMLNKGAYYAQHSDVSGDWRPMGSAPHDGTVIEIRCTYGVAPWYELYRWQTHFKIRVQHMSPDDVFNAGVVKLTGETVEYDDPKGRWAKVGDDNSYFDDDPSFSWRPYSGNVNTYVDPTGGAQNSPAYWRGAAARSSGLPVDAFERNTQRNISSRKSWWDWLFGN